MSLVKGTLNCGRTRNRSEPVETLQIHVLKRCSGNVYEAPLTRSDQCIEQRSKRCKGTIILVVQGTDYIPENLDPQRLNIVNLCGNR